MKEIWYVEIRGFLGSVLRYGINLFSYRSYPIQLIPYGTLFVNCLGCFLAGISVALFKKYNLNIESLNSGVLNVEKKVKWFSKGIKIN